MDNCDDAYGFPPYPLIAQYLYTRRGVDLRDRRARRRLQRARRLAGDAAALDLDGLVAARPRLMALELESRRAAEAGRRGPAGRAADRGRGRGAGCLGVARSQQRAVRRLLPRQPGRRVSSLAAGGIRSALACIMRSHRGVAGGALLVLSGSITGAALAVAGSRVVHAPALLAAMLLGGAPRALPRPSRFLSSRTDAPKRVTVPIKPVELERFVVRRWLTAAMLLGIVVAALLVRCGTSTTSATTATRPSMPARARASRTTRSSPRTSRCSAPTRCSSSRSSRSATSSTRATGSDERQRSASARSACWRRSSSGACSTASAWG